MKLFQRHLFYLAAICICFSCGHIFGAYQSKPSAGCGKPSDSFGVRQKHIINYAPKTCPKALIVIDPGHGGKDYGTHAKPPKSYEEKQLTLATAHILNMALQKLGHNTLMTRENDCFVALEDRASFANINNADLFISVHYNSAPNKAAEGIEVYFYENDSNKARIDQSKKAACQVLDSIQKSTSTKSRGVKHGNYAVIRETKMPAILIEGGFLTNDNELEKIKDKNYLKKLAWGIAKGVDQYLNARKGTEGDLAYKQTQSTSNNLKQLDYDQKEQDLHKELNIPKGRPFPHGKPLPHNTRQKAHNKLPKGREMPKSKGLPKSNFEERFIKNRPLLHLEPQK